VEHSEQISIARNATTDGEVKASEKQEQTDCIEWTDEPSMTTYTEHQQHQRRNAPAQRVDIRLRALQHAKPTKRLQPAK
jgi:hypothetical protein